MTATADHRWDHAQVTSPTLGQTVAVIAARGLPTVPGGNRLQTLSIYLPATAATAALVGTPVTALPITGTALPRYQVHVHGGAWRDPFLDSTSIEPAVAHAFASPDATPLAAIASINYTLTQFPNHPGDPYDAIKDHHADPAREAVHPRHVHDVLDGLALLKSLGLEDGSYVLTAHSCGACIAFQATLQAPAAYGLADVADPPVPAAVVGINGLYDLPALVHALGPEHEINSHDYRVMLMNAFGPDERQWAAASPALFDPAAIAARVRSGKAPRLVLIDESVDDQLVPMTQRDRLAATLRRVDGVTVMIGNRSTGKHAEPWQKGDILWNSVCDALAALRADHLDGPLGPATT